MAKKRGAKNKHKRPAAEVKTPDPPQEDNIENTESKKDENEDDGDVTEDTSFKVEETVLRTGEKAREIVADIIVGVLLFLEEPYKTFVRCVEKLNLITFFLFKSVMQCWMAIYIAHQFLAFLGSVQNVPQGAKFQFPVTTAADFLSDFRNHLSWDIRIFCLTMISVFFTNDLLNIGKHDANHISNLWFVCLAESGLMLTTPPYEKMDDSLMALLLFTTPRFCFEVNCNNDYKHLKAFEPFLLFTQLVILVFWVFLISLFEVSKFVEAYVPDFLTPHVMDY